MHDNINPSHQKKKEKNNEATTPITILGKGKGMLLDPNKEGS